MGDHLALHSQPLCCSIRKNNFQSKRTWKPSNDSNLHKPKNVYGVNNYEEYTIFLCFGIVSTNLYSDFLLMISYWFLNKVWSLSCV